MWRFEQYVYAYSAIGLGLALISLTANWSDPRRLSPVRFLIAHMIWPVSMVVVLMCALLEP
jgi:hypothetical protein